LLELREVTGVRRDVAAVDGARVVVRAVLARRRDAAPQGVARARGRALVAVVALGARLAWRVHAAVGRIAVVDRAELVVVALGGLARLALAALAPVVDGAGVAVLAGVLVLLRDAAEHLVAADGEAGVRTHAVERRARLAGTLLAAARAVADVPVRLTAHAVRHGHVFTPSFRRADIGRAGVAVVLAGVTRDAAQAAILGVRAALTFPAVVDAARAARTFHTHATR